MNKHLKLFNNENEYLEFKASSAYVTPNVSYVENSEETHYNPSAKYRTVSGEPYCSGVTGYDKYVDIENQVSYDNGKTWETTATTPTLVEADSDDCKTPQYEYVEIGGVKWATMNVGANSITDTGLYFQWGDTQGYTAAQVGTDKNFEESDYKYYDNGSYTKYNYTDELITLQTSDDAVTAACGGNWRMPTVSEWQTLGEAVNSAWTADYQGSGVSGLVLTDKTDSSKVLFFPAAGDCIFGGVNNVGSNGGYWSSSLNADYDESSAYCMYFGSGSVNWNDYNMRYIGYQVCGVLDDN